MNHRAVKAVNFCRWGVDFQFADELARSEIRLLGIEPSHDLASFKARLAIEIARFDVADSLRF